jgi:hypothetical protein
VSIVRQRRIHAVTKNLANFFLQAGKIYTREEYKKLDKVPYNLLSIKKLLGSYDKALHLVKRHHPHHIQMVEMKQKADRLRTFQSALEGIKASEPIAKPAVKPAVIKDKDDE